MANPHAARLDRAREQLSERGVDALLLGPSADLVYLTGYDAPLLERLTLLVLPAKGEPRLVVPRLEAPLARGHLGDLDLEVAAWDETEDPVALVRAALGDAAADGRLGVGDRLWSTFLLRLQAALPAADFTVASSVTRALRMVKDTAEIEALAAAAAAVDQVVDGLAGLRWAGRSERDVAREIDEAIRAAGHDETCFVIVGSGPNGASPHHAAGPRVIQPGDAVVIDIGGRRAGYCSDTTRTLVVGEPPPGFAELYQVLQAAQEAGCRAVAPGVPAEAVDAACRERIAEAGYGAHFVHRTGHGIGLEEHEDPYIVAGNDERLAAGMVFSVEPGIYLDGRYGARIEDIVVCTDDGVRRLNTTSRDLRVVAG
jgi:Xaa-Pro aminopeptidase